MSVEFSGEYACHSLGVNFDANVDGKSVVCSVSMEALTDIDPNHRDCTPEQQFLKNRVSFECIAEAKILTGATSPVVIRSADVQRDDHGT